MKQIKFLIFLLISFAVMTASAMADSVDPASFSATLGIGDSVTIRKTVTIDDAPPTEGLLDVMFLIDTSGSMGGEIDAAKAAAADILAGLSGFGDLAAGVGYYDEPGPGPGWPDAIVEDLSTSADATIFDSITLGMGGGGGDFPEEGIRGVTEVATGASWRPDASKFIIALGDATFKESDGFTLGGAYAAMDAIDATFIGIDYGYMTRDDWGGISPELLADHTGGSIVTAGGLSVDDLVADIIAGITEAFAEYSKVTLDGTAGMPGVGVDVVAVGDGAVGDTFVGDWTREEEREFVFDVTFTGLAEGTWKFPTYAKVDGGATAVEKDVITVDTIPEPTTMLLFGFGLIGLAGVTRRKS